MTLTQVRQGDILFERIEKLPPKLKIVKSRIIVQGTATGHAHRIRASKTSDLLRADDGTMYVDARRVAYADHEEHSSRALAKGAWVIVRQRENTPEGWANVSD